MSQSVPSHYDWPSIPPVMRNTDTEGHEVSFLLFYTRGQTQWPNPNQRNNPNTTAKPNPTNRYVILRPNKALGNLYQNFSLHLIINYNLEHKDISKLNEFLACLMHT